MHIGRCFLLMNKYFQGGRKQEEPEQPHNQVGKISHKKDLKTLQSQRQPGTENKLETMLKKTQQRALLESSYSLYCRGTLLFISCEHLQHCQGKPR